MEADEGYDSFMRIRIPTRLVFLCAVIILVTCSLIAYSYAASGTQSPSKLPAIIASYTKFGATPIVETPSWVAPARTANATAAHVVYYTVKNNGAATSSYADFPTFANAAYSDSRGWPLGPEPWSTKLAIRLE